ncbi:MAG: 3-hydroxyacyl-ACP dehydratase FabZ [Nevskiales bacterium]|nr:3-hydroxyacyl-ACP dehydratase FabZ [Nevskiales bacterium]
MSPTTFDIRDILRLLPHRYPFLLVDRVTDYSGGETLTALKNVTFNEPFFPGHFPGVPTMPGVMILEALAQASGLLAVLKSGIRPESGYLLYFAGVDRARFKRPVIPGDRLQLHAQLLVHKRDVWKFAARATVGDALACEAEMLCALKNAQDSGRA